MTFFYVGLQEQNIVQIVMYQYPTFIVEDKKNGEKVYLGKNKPCGITSIVLFVSYGSETRKGRNSWQMGTFLRREQSGTECKRFFEAMKTLSVTMYWKDV